MRGTDAATPSQTALKSNGAQVRRLSSRIQVAEREARSSGRAGSLCCVRDLDISREDSAANLIAGVVKVNVSAVWLRQFALARLAIGTRGEGN